MRLTTVGRRSGKERVAILGYCEDGPNLVTIAMNGWIDAEPAWWLNLQASPEACAKDLFQQLQKEYPGVFPDSQLRTLQRRVKQWRSEIARRLIMSSEEALLPVFAISAPPASVQD